MRLGTGRGSLNVTSSTGRTVVRSLNRNFHCPSGPHTTLVDGVSAVRNITGSRVSLNGNSARGVQTALRVLRGGTLGRNGRFRVMVPIPAFSYTRVCTGSVNIPIIGVPLAARGCSCSFSRLRGMTSSFSNVDLLCVYGPGGPANVVASASELGA